MLPWGLIRALASWAGSLTGVTRRRRRRSSSDTLRLAATQSQPQTSYLVAASVELLDSRAFPHILDTVIAASGPHELIAFRQTARDAQRQADAQLFAHVAMVALDYPFVEYWSGVDMSVRLPVQPRGDALTSPEYAARLAHTRALDLYPAGARSTSPAATPTIFRAEWASRVWPASLLTSESEALSVVRRADSTMIHPPADTLVDFINLADPSPPDAGFIHASGEFKHYVLHLAFSQESHNLPRGLVVRGAKRSHALENVTIVLAPEAESDLLDGDFELAHEAGRGDRYDVLLPFMHSLVPWLAGGAKLTLVGAERCHPLYLGLAPGTPIESRRMRRRRRLWGAPGFFGPLKVGGELISPALAAALRSRVYEISVADANFGRSADENWHWDRSEVERAQQVAGTMIIVGYDEWSREQDRLVAEWSPALPIKICEGS